MKGMVQQKHLVLLQLVSTMAMDFHFLQAEIDSLAQTEDNLSGNYLGYFNQKNRQGLTQYLPGTAILLSLLWKATSIYNFLPYIYFQLILDSILIACFFLCLKITIQE